MNCRETQKLLSPHHDDELSPEKRLAADAHFDNCSACTTDLDTIRRLSAITSKLIDVEPPEHLWKQIRERLDLMQEAQDSPLSGKLPQVRGQSTRLAWRSSAALLVIAASVFFLLFTAGLGVYFDRQDSHRQDDLAAYWRRFEAEPRQAQVRLLARYSGRAVSAQQTLRYVGYRALAARQKPAGIAVEKTYLLDMPSCRCIETVCHRADGTVIAVFEHSQEQPGWFQGRPQRLVVSGGASCRVTELGNQLAASWRVGRRTVTIVGLRDVEELRQWVLALAPARRQTARELHALPSRRRFFRAWCKNIANWRPSSSASGEIWAAPQKGRFSRLPHQRTFYKRSTPLSF